MQGSVHIYDIHELLLFTREQSVDRVDKLGSDSSVHVSQEIITHQLDYNELCSFHLFVTRCVL